MESRRLCQSHEDVEHGKPDPEIYLLVARQLDVSPSACLMMEDSLVGVQAALSAGTDVIAVTTPFTWQQFRERALLDRRWVVDDPDTLPWRRAPADRDPCPTGVKIIP